MMSIGPPLKPRALPFRKSAPNASPAAHRRCGAAWSGGSPCGLVRWRRLACDACPRRSGRHIAGHRGAGHHRREAATMRKDSRNPERTMPSPRPVALVTGAAKRLGAAIARRLHAEGYDLALHCRDSRAEAVAFATELESIRPGSALVLQADLAQFDRLPELVARAVGHFGRLDALVNSAAAFFPTPFGTVTPAQWDELFAVNLR